MKITLAISMLVLIFPFTPVWGDITADFENYSEDGIGTQFTDSRSGFQFNSRVDFNRSPVDFTIDYETGDAILPQVHSNYLSMMGLGRGGGLSLGGAAPFIITFPVPTQAVSMDILFAPSPDHSLTLIGLDANQPNVAQVTYDLEVFPTSWSTAQVGLNSPIPFTQLFVRPAESMYMGYDNITLPASAIPEPGTLMMLLLGPAIVFTSDRKFKASRKRQEQICAAGPGWPSPAGGDAD